MGRPKKKNPLVKVSTKTQDSKLKTNSGSVSGSGQNQCQDQDYSVLVVGQDKSGSGSGQDEVRIRMNEIRVRLRIRKNSVEFICYNSIFHNKLAPSVGRLRKKEIKMVITRFDIEKFYGKTDFGLWRIKMKALLVHQGLADALKDDSSSDEEESSSVAVERVKMMEKAHSAIILCLGDKVLREVSKESTAKGVWDKLESLYMVKTLANRLYMKQKFDSVAGINAVKDLLRS
ncbi:hypothetical protein ACS0TY_035710 [Phlomoides rotata]